MTYKCRYCHKDFVKETSLAVHMCEPKRRFQEQDERGVQLGLQAYLKFYEMTQGSARLKTFEDFAASPYYRAFVKFGRYCVDIRAINPARFMEWLLKNNKKIDHWARDTMYTEYLTEYLKIENVNDALTRALEFGQTWSEEKGHPAKDCLRYGNTMRILSEIAKGRISAWVIYNCESGQKFLSELDASQISMIYPYIDSEAWTKKFATYLADQEYIREKLKEEGW